MHKYSLLAIAFILLMSACGKNRDPQNMADMKDPSAVDSMMYYFGEMQAAAYWQDAETDTTLFTQESRDEFIEGFKAAMALDHDNPAYNKGLQLGLRLGLRLREFHDRYGEDFPKDILIASLRNSLESDNRENVAAAQKGFYKVKDLLELRAANSELEDSKVLLAKKGKELGYKMVSDTLFAKDVSAAGSGSKFKDGDRVAIEVSASTLDGKEIIARQFPDSITIGEGRVPRIVCLGLHTMTNGQTRTFMTTPRTLFGKRYASYHLPSDQPVLFTVKAIQN